MKKNILKFFILLAAGWVGGFSCQWLFPARSADAASRIMQADQLWIYAADGTHRIQMATYTGGGEKGLPFFGLSDNSTNLRLLLRLAGPNESPVLIFKDRSGMDRLVMGLNYSGGDEKPFITATDASGNTHSLLK